MRFMRWAAIIVLILSLYFVFQPWIFIAEKGLTASGINALSINFGRPGYVNLTFVPLIILLILLNKLWSLKVAFFISAFNLAWVIRNFIVFSGCSGGICPQRLPGLWFYLICSLISILLLLLVPKAETRAEPVV